MQGPRSVSAEHDYLVEQIEELKRRLLERNREYESLRRRERDYTAMSSSAMKDYNKCR